MKKRKLKVGGLFFYFLVTFALVVSLNSSARAECNPIALINSLIAEATNADAPPGKINHLKKALAHLPNDIPGAIEDLGKFRDQIVKVPFIPDALAARLAQEAQTTINCLDGTNTLPVCQGITANPPSPVASGTAVNLTVQATDVDNDILYYTFSANGQEFQAISELNTATWTSPAVAGNQTISVVVSDQIDQAVCTLDIQVGGQLAWREIAGSATGGGISYDRYLFDNLGSVVLDRFGVPWVFYASADLSSSPTAGMGFVRKLDNGIWADVGDINVYLLTLPAGGNYDDASFSILAFDNNNVPYLSFSINQIVYVARYNAGTNGWEDVGSGGGITTGESPSAVAFDNSNNAYIAFVNTSGEVAVIKYDSLNLIWSPISGNQPGGGIFTGIGSAELQALVDNQNRLYIFWADAEEVTLAPMWHAIYALMYNGSGWQGVGGNTTVGSGVPGQAIAIPWMNTFRVVGVPNSSEIYLAWGDRVPVANINQVHVMKYNGASWALVGGEVSGNTTDQSFLFEGSPDLAVDSLGLPYVAYVGNCATLCSIYVKRFDGSNWVGVGNSTSGFGISDGVFLGEWLSHISLTQINNTDVPYVSYLPVVNASPWQGEVYLKRYCHE